MPRKSRCTEIEKAIREHLKEAVHSMTTITDESLMKIAECSRRTFYKYVTLGSQIQKEIEQARDSQKRHIQSESSVAAHEDPEIIVTRLREEAENAKNGARELIAVQVRFVSNLIDLGVPSSIIDRAQRDAMSKPDRSVTRAGYPRNKVRRKFRFR